MFPSLEGSPIVSSSQFRVLLHKMKGKKSKALKEQIDALGSVDSCEAVLRFYHRFNSEGRYIEDKLYVPSNGKGISCMDIYLPSGSYVRFHMVSTFGNLRAFLDYAMRYFSDPKFVKSFSFEQSEDGQNFIAINVELKS